LGLENIGFPRHDWEIYISNVRIGKFDITEEDTIQHSNKIDSKY